MYQWCVSDDAQLSGPAKCTRKKAINYRAKDVDHCPKWKLAGTPQAQANERATMAGPAEATLPANRGTKRAISTEFAWCENTEFMFKNGLVENHDLRNSFSRQRRWSASTNVASRDQITNQRTRRNAAADAGPLDRGNMRRKRLYRLLPRVRDCSWDRSRSGANVASRLRAQNPLGA